MKGAFGGMLDKKAGTSSKIDASTRPSQTSNGLFEDSASVQSQSNVSASENAVLSRKATSSGKEGLRGSIGGVSSDKAGMRTRQVPTADASSVTSSHASTLINSIRREVSPVIHIAAHYSTNFLRFSPAGKLSSQTYKTSHVEII